jgi:hypothetical protein
MAVVAVLWGSCAPSAMLVAVDVLLLKWVRCVYNFLPGFGLQFLFVITCCVQFCCIRLCFCCCTSLNVGIGVCVVARVLLGSVGI